ncbi:MAG TPA: pyridoxamine 5'-phosphate oxidase [Gemmatimonadales bacterium]|nr:pyridoxamine 5'-phosphate oxidase [Gemmatimonadales bacterium]
MPTIAELRREYARSRLDERDLAADPFAMFASWFAQAVETAVPEPNAMALATAAPNGTPSARIVLLKAVDQNGFVFFTDYRSRKATELSANPMAALVFYWHELERQVRVVGSVARIPGTESDAYYRTRPLGSRFGAWASEQSAVLSSRTELEERLASVEARHPDGDVPRPSHWGGFRVAPSEVEFWQGRESRLHDRLRYRRAGPDQPWIVERLSP